MREERMTLMHDVCGMIAHASDHDLALGQIVKHIAEVLNAQICLISLLQAESGHLEVQAAYGFQVNENPDAAPFRNILELACKRSKTINTVLRAMFPADTEDSAQQISQVNSLMAVPLVVSGKAIGTLAIGRRSRQVFPARLVAGAG